MDKMDAFSIVQFAIGGICLLITLAVWMSATVQGKEIKDKRPFIVGLVAAVLFFITSVVGWVVFWETALAIVAIIVIILLLGAL